MWQLFVKGLEGKTMLFRIENRHPEKTTVLELKKRVQERTGIPPPDQRLIYGGKQLEDKRCLGEYSEQGLGNECTIFLVMRLPGGGSKASRPEERYRPSPSTRKRIHNNVDPSIPRCKGPCMITLDEDHCVCMPCGHPITPDALMDYSWNEVGSGRKCEIRCPYGNECDQERPLEVIKRYSGAAPKDIQMLADSLSNNYWKKDPHVSECPGCHSLCERQDKSDNCVRCYICTRNKKGTYYFCWQCLQPWKNSPINHNNKCGNCSCHGVTDILEKLRKAPKTIVVGVEVPSLRACPNCGSLIEHKEKCKQMTCVKCDVKFCFICLRMQTQGCWTCGDYNDACSPAPCQETVPSRESV